MIIVTGGAGFIGSNIIKGLNDQGHTNIIAVDDLTYGDKFHNLVGCDIADYWDQEDFLHAVHHPDDRLASVRAVFHQGACSDTTERNGRKMMALNFDYSKAMFDFCQYHRVPLIYASSAAVYGGSKQFTETRANESPLNIYGYSKYLFDQYVRRHLFDLSAPVTGLRYFNVYGPGEWHKGNMASLVYQLHQKLLQGDEELKLFEGSDGYANGEQRRDFVYVRDIVDINLWCWQNSISGIYNAGTGQSQTFNELARAVVQFHGRGYITYRPFPDTLKGRYQSFTQADMTALAEAGYSKPFYNVEQGVSDYLKRIA